MHTCNMLAAKLEIASSIIIVVIPEKLHSELLKILNILCMVIIDTPAVRVHASFIPHT